MKRSALISKPHPRKGTETASAPASIQQAFPHFKTTSPQGDGNCVCSCVNTAGFSAFQNHIPARGRSSKKPPYGEAYEKGAVCNDLTPKVSFPKSNLNFWGTGHIFVGLFCHKLAALAGSFVPMILGSCLETFPAVPKHKEIPLVLASPAVMLAFLAQRLDDLV